MMSDLEYLGVSERVIEEVNVFAKFQAINNDIIGPCRHLNETRNALICPV